MAVILVKLQTAFFTKILAMSLNIYFRIDDIDFSLDAYQHLKYGIYVNGYHGMGLLYIDGEWSTRTLHMAAYVKPVLDKIALAKAKAKWGLPDHVKQHITSAKYYIDTNVFEIQLNRHTTTFEWFAQQLADVKTDARIRLNLGGFPEWYEIEKGDEFDALWALASH